MLSLVTLISSGCRRFFYIISVSLLTLRSIEIYTSATFNPLFPAPIAHLTRVHAEYLHDPVSIQRSPFIVLFSLWVASWNSGISSFTHSKYIFPIYPRPLQTCLYHSCSINKYFYAAANSFLHHLGCQMLLVVVYRVCIRTRRGLCM